MRNSISINNLNAKLNANLTLDIIIYKDGKYFNSLCPSVNVSSFGESEKDALEGINEALVLFFEDLLSRGMLELALLELGWTLQKVPQINFKQPLNSNANAVKIHPGATVQKLNIPLALA